jgi:hypothetical protein
MALCRLLGGCPCFGWNWYLHLEGSFKIKVSVFFETLEISPWDYNIHTDEGGRFFCSVGNHLEGNGIHKYGGNKFL